MQTTEIQTLVQAYARHGSETAFRELVQRYIGLVYSTALRQVGGQTHLAEDIAQTVFADFAEKARKLPSNVLLGGWLHRHTCFVASNTLRSERRRLHRETQAAQMNSLNDASDEQWKKLAPVLDEAINQLPPEDRDAVMLRFFEQRAFRSIGDELGVSDDTAQKRVSRAVDKLRDLLVKQGVTLSATALATILANQAIGALPANLAENIAGNALAKTAGSSGATKYFLSAKLLLALMAVFSVAVVTPLILKQLDKNRVAPAPLSSAGTSVETNENSANIATEKSAESASNNSALKMAAQNSESSNRLELIILSAVTRRPVPNATVEMRASAKNFVVKKLTADRVGVCDVEILPDLKSLELTTQIDGFADTRLTWNVERGEKIPRKYTLELDRAVLIGGRVVGPDNEPVEGAKVGFNHNDDPVSKKLPESHDFGWIQVTTDSEGRWQINRIANEMLNRIYGSAKHSNYVDTSLVFSRDLKIEEQLRNRDYVFHLGKGATIHGTVVDSDNSPISDAKVFFGGRMMSSSRETKSLADGSFVLVGCKPSKDLLSAEAKGFATSTTEIDPENSSGPYKIQLQRGKVLRVLVVDKNGVPVPKADVWLDTLTGSFGNEPKRVQANFEKRTGNDGRLVWDSAPEGELKFYIHKTGYMSLRELKLGADGEEKVVTLPPALVVRGTVKNENGQPIPRFKIICGYPGTSYEPTTLKERSIPNWSRFDRDWLNFSGGSYRHSFDDAMIHGIKNPGYVLKFQAEGYADFVSRILAPDEGEVQLDVVLKRAATPIITVLLPDGRPAARADVGLVSPGSKLNFVPGGFSRVNNENGAALLMTDEKGQFRLPADSSVSRIVVAHPDGFVDMTPQALVTSQQVSLQPWGALEGTYLSGGKPLVGRGLTIGFDNSDESISYDFQSHVTTDAEGHFAFPKLLPGKHKLIAMIPLKITPISGAWENRGLQDVEIQSGQTTEITIGNSGYTVIAHFVFPEEFKRESGTHLFTSVHVPFPMPPKEILTNSEALKQWGQRPEVKQLALAPHYALDEKPNGTWVAENVLPGTYEVSAIVLDQKNNAEKAQIAWQGKTTVTIPENPAVGTIDVGTIPLRQEEPR